MFTFYSLFSLFVSHGQCPLSVFLFVPPSPVFLCPSILRQNLPSVPISPLSGLSIFFSPRWPCRHPLPSVSLALLYPRASKPLSSPSCFTLIFLPRLWLFISLSSLSVSVWCLTLSVCPLLVLCHRTDAWLGSQQLSRHVPRPSVAYTAGPRGWGGSWEWRVYSGLVMNIHVVLDVPPKQKMAPHKRLHPFSKKKKKEREARGKKRGSDGVDGWRKWRG